jgi:cyclophilin family peptidyl-prolyl cis-trans isomerase
MLKRLFAVVACFAMLAPILAMAQTKGSPRMKITTSHGVIVLELDAEKAPETTKNFQRYVTQGHYDGTVFHRVIPGFMIQGGGFEPGLSQKPTGSSIENEADNGLKNEVGTIAMARTSDPHSATAQFFINTADNDFLNHTARNPRGWGYAVFGRVVEGMDVVRKIEAVATRTVGSHGAVPVEDVVIEKIEAE